jgi:ubiquinone biosynthesis O-methyltransferase
MPLFLTLSVLDKDRYMAVERFDPAVEQNKMVLDHYARYLFASPLVQNKRALDVACGPGYGSKLLIEQHAREVIGVDVSEEAVTYAKEHYAHERITYLRRDILALSTDEIGTFDVIVCFETLEHVSDPEQTVDVLARLLAPDGVLVISVPNEGEVASSNPYHLTIFTQERFLQLLHVHFKTVQPYFQNYCLASTIWRNEDRSAETQPDHRLLQRLPALAYTYGHTVQEVANADCFIAVCTHASEQELAALTVQAGAIWRDVESYVAEMNKGRKWLETQVQNWQTMANQQQDAVIHLQKHVAELEQAKTWLDEQRATLQRSIEQQQAWIAELEQGKAWLDEQRANWQSEAERLGATVAEQQQWIVELEQAKTWHEQQASHWKQQAEKVPRIIRKITDST